MSRFNKDGVHFIVRSKENRKYAEIESLLKENQCTDLEGLDLVKGSMVYLYTGVPIHNKRNNIHYREELVEEPLRLIVPKSRSNSGKEFWFISNEFDLSPEEITQSYRRRWDIEVFFRFIKQEFHVSHLVSLNKNRIRVMRYMTLIVPMLILIYKKNQQYRLQTAKRRFKMEVRNLLIALMISLAGGEQDRVFKT